MGRRGLRWVVWWTLERLIEDETGRRLCWVNLILGFEAARDSFLDRGVKR